MCTNVLELQIFLLKLKIICRWQGDGRRKRNEIHNEYHLLKLLRSLEADVHVYWPSYILSFDDLEIEKYFDPSSRLPARLDVINHKSNSQINFVAIHYKFCNKLNDLSLFCKKRSSKKWEVIIFILKEATTQHGNNFTNEEGKEKWEKIADENSSNDILASVDDLSKHYWIVFWLSTTCRLTLKHFFCAVRNFSSF